MKYDVVIIGGGPAGVSAAVYAKSRGMKVVILEQNKIGGIVGNVSTVTHYAGIIAEETGETFSKRLEDQALNAGVEIRYEKAAQINLKEKIVETDKERYEAKAIILANGSTPRKLGIPGELELAGHGIGLNAARDGHNYEGRNIYVVGGADGAIKEAIYLAKYAKKLTIIHFEDKLGCIYEFKDKLKNLDNVDTLLNTRLTAVMGETAVDKLELTDEVTGEKRIVEDEGCGVFVYAGLIPNTEMYEELELDNGFIKVNDKMETGIEGVYAAGDIRVKQVRQAATAVADGAIAAINACAYINRGQDVKTP